MLHQGTPQFIQAHGGTIKGVAFSPRERYIFCSGGTDGRVNVYSALQGQHLMSTKLTSPNAMKNITAVKFNADGSRILSTTSRRLSVIDAERGELVCSYDNCTYSGKERAPLAADPCSPHLATCVCTNGKGWITFDLRKPQPAVFALNIHSSLIRDITYLDRSWPYGASNQGTIVTLSCDGTCNLRSRDNQDFHTFRVNHRANSVAATPDRYAGKNDGSRLESILMIGGDGLTAFVPSAQNRESELRNYSTVDVPIQKLKFTSNGHMLYSCTSNGQVVRYRRAAIDQIYLGEVYSHEDEIIDMDISPNDEYIVTAASNGQIGLLCLGAPSYGWTGFMQFA